MLLERNIHNRKFECTPIDCFFHRLDAGLFCSIFLPADSFAMPLNTVYEARQEGGFFKC